MKNFDYTDDSIPWNRYRNQVLNRLAKNTDLNNLSSTSSENKPNLLEIGCGKGEWISRWKMNSCQVRFTGFDFQLSRLQILRSVYEMEHVCQADAVNMPFQDKSFDLVFQSTVFTSILSVELRRKAAKEMLRVLRPSGQILWYDFTFNNPSNSAVHGIPKHDLKLLFPNCSIDATKVMLAPPLARLITKFSIPAAHILDSFKFLNTHLWVIIRPR